MSVLRGSWVEKAGALWHDNVDHIVLGTVLSEFRINFTNRRHSAARKTNVTYGRAFRSLEEMPAAYVLHPWGEDLPRLRLTCRLGFVSSVDFPHAEQSRAHRADMLQRHFLMSFLTLLLFSWQIPTDPPTQVSTHAPSSYTAYSDPWPFAIRPKWTKLSQPL